MTDDPVKTLTNAFKAVMRRPNTSQDLGKVLQALSMELGYVSAEITDRGISAETLDETIKKSMLRGVDLHLQVSSRARAKEAIEEEAAA